MEKGQVLDTCFEGSLAKAVAEMADSRDGELDDAEMTRLEVVLRNAKSKRGK